jgi:hypothetical protein
MRRMKEKVKKKKDETNTVKMAARCVCQAPFSNPKAEPEISFGYAGAERMKNPLAGLQWRGIFDTI